MEALSKESTPENSLEEKKFLDEKLEERAAKLLVKKQYRDVNLNAAANRPEESFFSKLDSNLRRNTAFVKKVKSITEAQRDTLIKEMNSVNLTRYIGELADGIVEAKLKMTDIGAALHICSLLHQRYAEFPVVLLEKWQKCLALRKDEKAINPSKMRVDIRFYAELISIGVFTLREGLPLLGNLLTNLVNNDKDEHINLPIILSFCKHCGEDYCGIIGRKLRLLVEKYGVDVPRTSMLTPERQKNVRSLLKEYYSSLCKHLTKDYKEMQAMKRQNRRILETKGELSTERKDKFEAAESNFHKLFANTQQLSDALDEDMPPLPEGANDEPEVAVGIDIGNRFKNNEFDTENSIWEDEDTRNFYENLHDLKAFIPAILFKDSARPATPSDSPEKVIEEEVEVEDIDSIEDDEELKLVDESEKKIDSEKVEETSEIPDAEPEEEPEPTGGLASKVLLDSFLTSLPRCVNRELIDKASVDFCMNLNTKPNRRKLVKALFLVPRTRLDLLPFYARFVATLNPCMPDIATDLAAMLKQDFRHHIYKKDQINIESKVKTVRFIGELVKFKMYSKAEALLCLKILLADFSHHHIEMTCNLLETCGRYLFRSPDSHTRTKVYLDQMMRKKAVMAIDSRYATMIENAFYYCNPPEVQPSVRKERPIMHEYIRKLLYKDLGKNNTEKILRLMRKLNWDDPDISFYATKCLTAIWNVKYYNIRSVANLLAGLVTSREQIGHHVVDGVLEDIRLGMEVNNVKYNQRRVSAVRYLGELYNYRMVESSVIFKTVYSFIVFGTSQFDTSAEYDPPDSLFRIRLVCVLLETCGQYFNSGSSKKKLDYFLNYFQRYFWYKHSLDVWSAENPFPLPLHFMVKDTITLMRPKFKFAESYEEAQKTVEEMEKELIFKLNEMFPPQSSDSQEDGENRLQTVPETDEEIDQDGDEFDDDDENDIENEDEGGSQSLGGSQSQPLEENDDEGDDGQINTSASQAADQEDVEFIPGGPKRVTCPEDDDFMTAFDKMLAENIQHRSQENVKMPQVDISVPVNVRSNIKKTVTIKENEDEPVIETRNTMHFILMTRKGNKQQYRNLEVPVSSELALNLRDREEAERVEKERVKRLTLDINERQEEEDYQEMLVSQQRPVMMNLNRERRQKYQHPKGAPDADLIFGNKKR
ncbi:Regulator of nonsense transcripts upf2, variant 2 [Chamberlinius hualienensis]